MQQMKILSFFIMLSISGCSLLGGDLLVNVKGAIPVEESGEGRGNCVLFAVNANNNERLGVGEQIAPPDFLSMIMIVVSGSKRPYYFIAECQDGRTFRSGEFFIGGPGRVNFIDRPLDIGMLTETTKADNNE